MDSKNKKITILFVLNILKEASSKDKPITQSLITKTINFAGIKCDRRTVASDIKVLQEFGYNIVTNKCGGCYLANKEPKFSIKQYKFIYNSVNKNKSKDKRINISNEFSPTLLGGIIGDIAGSRFEFNATHSKDFELLVMGENYMKPEQSYEEFKATCRFTDDTVMTIAIANAMLEANGNYDNLSDIAIRNMKYYGKKYPLAGYGASFNTWLTLPVAESFNSYGDGSAMRISSVPYFAKSLEEVKELSRKVTIVTHNHPEGLKGAEATAVAIWLALNFHSKNEIKKYIEDNYYKLDFTFEKIWKLRENGHDESCQTNVPESIYAFLISNDYEDAIRTAISFGGDADTMACIAGSIAAAYYGVPKELKQKAMEFLPNNLKLVVKKFENNLKNLQ